MVQLVVVSLETPSLQVFFVLTECLTVVLQYCITWMISQAYLEQFQNIINGISILNRGFLDMELLKPILSATVLMSIHITGPLLAILRDPKTKHSHLTHIFQTLYNDMLEKNALTFLQTNEIATFASQEIFLKCLPKECIIVSLNEYIIEFKDYILQLVKLFLTTFAEGLSIQKGAIFGFGPKSDDDTGTLLKISSVEIFEKLNKVEIHNLGEERSVGYINYELQIRGKANLECASKQMILNKGRDLIKSQDLSKLKKPAQKIKELKLQWNDKMK